MNKLSAFNQRGEEIPDPRPVELPVGFVRPPTINEMVQKLVRQHLEQNGDADKIESFEDADDFDIDDDPIDPSTPYEDNFEPEQPGIIARQQEIRSGFVEDVPHEKIEKARETLSKYKKKKEGGNSRGNHPVSAAREGGDSRGNGVVSAASEGEGEGNV